MPGQWDSSMKQLFTAYPDHFIAWLLEGAVYLGELSTHLNPGKFLLNHLGNSALSDYYHSYR